MEGVFIQKNQSINFDTPDISSAGSKLLVKCENVEIMEHTIIKGATVWLSPSEDESAIEFFYIHTGRIEIELDTETVNLESGDSVTIKSLKRNVMLKALTNASMVSVSTKPFYEEVHDFETYLKKLLTQINEKDHYTYQHSMNVMNYAVLISKAMIEPNNNSETVLKDIVIASLFHDVGKCFTPDEILKKQGKLESEEMKVIRHHPVDTGRLLRKYYNNRIAEIAENHHERIDGSGYPFGLSGHELSTEAKILAVVDAFDAMTTDRGYNNVKSFADAAEELYNLPHLFDHEVASVLKRLVDEGKIAQARKKNDGQQ